MLRDAGVEVVSTWPDHVAEVRAEGKTDADLSPGERLDAARQCEAQIRKSDVLLVLGGERLSEGRSYELGYARAMHVPIVFAGRLATIFGEPREGEEWCDTDSAAVALIAGRAAVASVARGSG